MTLTEPDVDLLIDAGWLVLPSPTTLAGLDDEAVDEMRDAFMRGELTLLWSVN